MIPVIFSLNMSSLNMSLLNRSFGVLRRSLVYVGLMGVAVASFTACTTYRINVQQGNFVSKEMAAQLKIGMSKGQVRFILGSPLLTSTFHEHRWDYIFYSKPNGTIQAKKYQFTLYFENDRLTKFSDIELPSEPRGVQPEAQLPLDVNANASSNDVLKDQAPKVERDVVNVAPVDASPSVGTQDVPPVSTETQR